MDIKELSKLILNNHVQDVDLSNIDLNGFDFSGCFIKDVIFSKGDQQGRKLENVNFKDAKLEHVSFDNATLENCSFDVSKSGNNPNLYRVSFRNCKFTGCRFRNATISWSDFRYSEINQATFECSKIEFCDFYRTFFLGVVIFRKSQISNSSLFYTYFDESSIIRKENLFNNRIIQQDINVYRKFLVEWNTYGTGERKSNQLNSKSDWNPTDSLKSRYADAEDIYKSLNGLWMSKGFIGDANWAYVRGRKMERKRMIAELFNSEKSINYRIKNLAKIFWSLLSDLMFGYGESIRKIILTYIILIFVFAYFYYALPEVSIQSYIYALGVSFKNMVAISSEEVMNATPLVDFLNVVQTTSGILMTGIFGFILGNKIRNQ